MAEGIVYLDVDDEITSAASRIRSSPGTKVALVVPYGSRIATSRMNFRLLSREAVVSNRRLSIVSGDAAARSLAASAGLPVFGSVPEYESSVAADRAEAVASSPSAPPPAAAADPRSVLEPAAPPDADSALASSATVVVPGPEAAPEPTPERLAEAPPSPPARKSQLPRRPPPEEPPPVARPARPEVPATAVAPVADGEHLEPGLPPLFGTRVRAPLVAAVALIALALVVVAVAAYVFLPAATITLVPKLQPVGPIQLTVSADPDAASVDPVRLVVPAVRVEVPVEASNTFTTTGVHVEQTAASGTVTFENYNPVSSNTIPSGSIVSTEGGIRFRTRASVTIPAGTFVLPSVIPSKRSVDVDAVDAGPAGNVPANSIRVVPQGENPDFLKVNNADPTTGGTKTETPQVSKAEVDMAVSQLQADLQASFEGAVESGAGAPAGATLFPTTAQLGTPTPDVDPQSYVGQPIQSFEIRLTATGTVIAVDPAPVRTLAESQITSKVSTGYQLVPGSAEVTVGEGLVGEDGQVSFLATARASEQAVVEADALRPLVKGKTAADAAAALKPYGDATVVLWPDWASTVTSMDSRLTIAVQSPSGATGGPGVASPSPRPSGSGTPRPSSSPKRSSAPSPAPS